MNAKAILDEWTGLRARASHVDSNSVGAVNSLGEPSTKPNLEGLSGFGPTDSPYQPDQSWNGGPHFLNPPGPRRLPTHLFPPVSKSPCECEQCSQQFRTATDQSSYESVYTRTISQQAAQQKCDERVQEIVFSQAYLRKALCEHGNTIFNRWRKRAWLSEARY